MLFCHVLFTTFCFCYTLDRTDDPNPLYTPMNSLAIHLSILRTAEMDETDIDRSESLKSEKAVKG